MNTDNKGVTVWVERFLGTGAKLLLDLQDQSLTRMFALRLLILFVNLNPCELLIFSKITMRNLIFPFFVKR